MGTGKPSFFFSAVNFGRWRAAALRSAYLVFSRLTLSRRGRCEATSNTRRSRNGTRSSSELAMLMRSALSRMSPASQTLMSRYCIRVTSSMPRTRSQTGAVSACGGVAGKSSRRMRRFSRSVNRLLLPMKRCSSVCAPRSRKFLPRNRGIPPARAASARRSPSGSLR